MAARSGPGGSLGSGARGRKGRRPGRAVDRRLRRGTFLLGSHGLSPRATARTGQRRACRAAALVYNLHHGHDHLDRFPDLLRKMLPHLYAINLNGMVPRGDQQGLKILPLGTDDLDLTILRTIRDSGYRGPLGIRGHTQDDVEERLRDNLDGLDWLVANLAGAPPVPRPKPRTPVPPLPAARAVPPYSLDLVEKIVAAAKAHGDIHRGASQFRAQTS